MRRCSDRLTPQTVVTLASGTTDVWPWDIDLTYAYGLTWAPRPVLQSYSAYTPFLDAADAAYLDGPGAPDHVLIAVRDVDGRYLPFDEPAAFRALSRRYMVVAQDGDFLVLSRREPVASRELRSFQTVHARLGDVVTVPAAAGRPVYASVSVPYSLRGQFMNGVVQAGELHIDLQLADGSVERHRFIPRVASDGLMLDTYIGSTADLRSYLEGARERPITAIRMTSDQPADYAGAVDVTFSAPAPDLSRRT